MAGPMAVDPTIRRQVIASASALLGADPGASLARIGRRAGVSRATIYRHFGSRRAVLEAARLAPPADARDRIIAAAPALLARGGLHAFSMDEVAVAAGLSRATVYRLFPTKAALFGDMVRTYSPFDAIVAVLDERGADPPEVVLPQVARAMASVGPERLAVMRTLILEIASGSHEALDGVAPIVPGVVARLVGYLERQIAAGALRPVEPILAVQAVLGPVAFHLLTRPVLERVTAFAFPVDEAASRLARIALEGLLPRESAA